MEREIINKAYSHARIDLSKEQLEELLPDGICRSLGEKKIITFGSTDELHQLLALAVYSVSEVHSEEMVLEYILVSEEHRGAGLARELLEYCSGTLKTCGIRSIYVRLVEKMDKIARRYDFFVRERFIPVLFSGHLMSYAFRDVKQCELMRHGGDLLGVYARKIRTYDHHMDVSVRQFMQLEKGFSIRENAYDTKHSRILLNGENIAGVMCLKQMDRKTFVLTGCHVKPDSNGKYMFAALLYSALHDVCASIGDDAEFVLQLYRLEYYEWVKKLFGQPGQDLMLQEYVRKL